MCTNTLYKYVSMFKSIHEPKCIVIYGNDNRTATCLLHFFNLVKVENEVKLES